MPCSRGCCDSFGEHVRSLSVASAALPNRGAAVNVADAKQAAFDRDGPAYKRLRAEGLQPVQIEGCAYAEATATERHHIEGGLPAGTGL